MAVGNAADETGSAGQDFGDLIVAHFSFYPQERQLLRTNILDGYYGLTGLAPPIYENLRSA